MPYLESSNGVNCKCVLFKISFLCVFCIYIHYPLMFNWSNIRTKYEEKFFLKCNVVIFRVWLSSPLFCKGIVPMTGRNRWFSWTTVKEHLKCVLYPYLYDWDINKILCNSHHERCRLIDTDNINTASGKGESLFLSGSPNSPWHHVPYVHFPSENSG